MDIENGQEYRLQLFFRDGFWQGAEQRSFDVLVNGAMAVDELDVAAHMNAGEGRDAAGVVFTYDFFSETDTLLVDLLHGSAWQDGNPVLNGFTVEIIPAPAALALLGLGAVPLLGRRRRRI